MSFVSRPQGLTLRRAQEALHAPAPADERFDPEFKVTMRCSKCGKFGFGPRRFMREALLEHQASCSARKTKEDEPFETRLFYLPQ